MARQAGHKPEEEKPFIDDSWSMPELLAYFAPDHQIDYEKLKTDLIYLTAQKIAGLLKELSHYADDNFWSFLAEEIKFGQNVKVQFALASRNTFAGKNESIGKGLLFSEEELNTPEPEKEKEEKEPEEQTPPKEPGPSQEQESSEKEADESKNEEEPKKKTYNTGGPYTKGFFDRPIVDVDFKLPKGMTKADLKDFFLYLESVYFEDTFIPAKMGRKVTFVLGALKPGDPQEGKEVYCSFKEAQARLIKSLREEEAAARQKTQTKKHQEISREFHMPDQDEMILDPWDEKEKDDISQEEWNALDEEAEESSWLNEDQEDEQENKNGRNEKEIAMDIEAGPQLESLVQIDPILAQVFHARKQQADFPWRKQPEAQARKTEEEKSQCLKYRPPSRPPAT